MPNLPPGHDGLRRRLLVAAFSSVLASGCAGPGEPAGASAGSAPEAATAEQDPAAPRQEDGAASGPRPAAEGAAPAPGQVTGGADEAPASPEQAPEPLEVRYGIPLPAPPSAPPLADEGRRKGFEFARAAGLDTLAKAREALASRRREAAERVAAEAERVLAASRDASGEGEDVRVTAYDEHGFAVEVGGVEVRHRWGTCPARLGHQVKSLALDPAGDAQALFWLGLYALERGLLDEAERAFDRAVNQNPVLAGQVPDVAALRQAHQVFRGTIERGPGDDGEVEVLWSFQGDRPDELADFESGAAVHVERAGGQLKVTGRARGSELSAARLRGVFTDHLRLELVVASLDPPPAVVIDAPRSSFLVRFARAASLAPLVEGAPGASLAEAPIELRRGARIAVEVRQAEDGRATITASVDGQAALSEEVALRGALRLRLGAAGSGTVRLGEARLTARLDGGWLRRSQALAPARAVELSAAVVARFWSGRAQGPSVLFAKTSAEDWFGLDQASEPAQEALTGGRARLMRGDLAGARNAFEEAIRAAPELPAANYLLGLTLLGDDPLAALSRFERAAAGIEGFYEARVAQAAALVRLGDDAGAAAALEQARALRPDFAPLHQVEASLRMLAGEHERARELLELADVLSPGDPLVFEALRRLEGLADGPGWVEPDVFEGSGLRLTTDRPGDAARLGRHLASVRALAAELLPALAEAPGFDRAGGDDADARPAQVLVFGERAEYERYAARTAARRSAGAMAHFDPRTRQLVAALPLEVDEEVLGAALGELYHEAFHQWCHERGATLPPWAAEGLAEVLRGTQLTYEGDRVLLRGGIDAALAEHLRTLTRGWDRRAPLLELVRRGPAAFFADEPQLAYAQAWTLAHLLTLSEDATLRRELQRYVAHFALAADPRKRAALGFDLLERAREQTLAQRADLEQRWEAATAALAERAEVAWPH